MQQLQIDVWNDESNCVLEVDSYLTLYRDVTVSGHYSLDYFAGRSQKGNGEGTEAGYKADHYFKYMDLMVEATNMWNECDLDYYMQAFAPVFTTLSGFLWIITSLTSIIINESEVEVYVGMSKASFDRDAAKGGQYFGLWTKHLLGVELQDATVDVSTQEYGTMS